jgi:hypothetical protein
MPHLETLDNAPRFALDVFNTGTVTQKGAIANAKIFEGIKQLGISPRDQETDHLASMSFRTATPEELGQQLTLTSGVKMTPKEQKTYGHAMAKIRNVIIARNPTLANNVAYYTMGNGQNQFVPLMNNETFTTNAVKTMESQNTSAWIANTLNIKKTHLPPTETLFNKDQSNTITNNPAKVPVEPLPANHVIISKQPKNKPIDLLDLQKRHYEEEKK